MPSYSDMYKKFNIEPQNIPQYKPAAEQAKSIKKFSLLRDVDISYSNKTEIIDKSKDIKEE